MARLLAAWAFLDAVANIRYPAGEPKFWWLVPSLDVVAVFATYAVLGRFRARLPRAAHVALVAAFVVLRLFWIGDGIRYRYFNRPLNLYLDLPLLPDLARLLLSTTAVGVFALGVGVFLIGTLLVAASVSRALRVAERSLERPLPVAVFAGVLVVFVAASPFHRPEARHEQRFVGAFAASGAFRLAQEGKFVLEVSGFRSAKLDEVERMQAKLRALPSDLATLRGANVLLFLIESYGETVLRRAEFAQRSSAAYAEFERELGPLGFSFASTLLDSPTYGGGSWLAHATLATGVRVENQMHVNLLEASRPLTMAERFRRAGYRTVRVEPGTARPTALAALAGFDQRYHAGAFDYRGPRFGWAPMPDQYAIDFVHRRELARASQPLFVEYALVSSHAPWSEQPEIVPDFDRIGDGSVYNSLKTVRFPIVWPDLEVAAAAYIRSICYDFDVLKRYLSEYVRGDTLVLILGDHQPAVEVAQDRDAYGVPLHVISRNSALIERFVARGYAPRMRPGSAQGEARPGLETLLPTLVSEFSSAGSRGPR